MHKIDILDHSGIREHFQFDHDFAKRPYLYEEVLYEIMQSFQEQLERLKGILPKGELTCTVYLEEEESDEISTTLASFETKRSVKGNYTFSIYYSSLLTISNCLLENQPKDLLISFHSTVLHELIHAADISTLKESENIIDESYKMYAAIDTLHPSSKTPHYKWNVQWALLIFFLKYRNEGIAILGQKMFIQSTDQSRKTEWKKCLNGFKLDLDWVFKTISELRFYTELETETAEYIYRIILQHVYEFSPFVLLEVMKTLHPEETENILRIEETIQHDNKLLSDEEACAFLQLCMNVDLSEYIHAVFQSPELNRDDLLSKQRLLECCAIIQNDRQHLTISEFAWNIGRIGFNQDKESFIKLMIENVGYKMSEQELIEGHRLLMSKNTEEDIISHIKKKAEILLPLAIEDKNEIAIWALTYLYDDQDMIHDPMHVLGYQDDWLVVDAALRMI